MSSQSIFATKIVVDSDSGRAKSPRRHIFSLSRFAGDGEPRILLFSPSQSYYLPKGSRYLFLSPLHETFAGLEKGLVRSGFPGIAIVHRSASLASCLRILGISGVKKQSKKIKKNQKLATARYICAVPISQNHSDSEFLEIGTLVMGHSLIRSLIRPHRSLTRLLHNVRFAHGNIFVQFLMCSESLCKRVIFPSPKRIPGRILWCNCLCYHCYVIAHGVLTNGSRIDEPARSHGNVSKTRWSFDTPLHSYE